MSALAETTAPDTQPADQQGLPIRLEEAARRLAQSHTLSPGVASLTLLRRLDGLESHLRSAYQHFAGSTEEELALSSAAEWLLDNYYLVQQAFRQVRQDLPEKFYRQLPKLGSSSYEGLPRTYAMARELMSTCGFYVDGDRIRRFVEAYQSVTTLSMGELWALPSMLRLATLERLSQALGLLLGERKAGDGKDHASEHAIVSNSVLSLRVFAVQDWVAFFEVTSRVERILRGDPAGIYPSMDAETRDRYRKAIEKLARAAARSEEEAAQEVVALAQSQDAPANLVSRAEQASPSMPSGFPGRLNATDAPPSGPAPVSTAQAMPPAAVHGSPQEAPLSAHVGFYLLDAGSGELEARLGIRPSATEHLRRWTVHHPAPLYLGAIALLGLAILFGLTRYASGVGGSLAQLIGVALLSLVPATTIAVDLVHWLITHTVPPRTLPKMDFRDGIPAECRTMVVVPVLVSDPAEVDFAVRQLELHYLGNMDPNLHFALLMSLPDAPEQHMPDDEALVQHTETGVRGLNTKYGHEAGGPFSLFQPERRWNPAEGVWMGWERKRGKLVEFNRLLTSTERRSPRGQLGILHSQPKVKYVITLDVDTALPGGGAQRLVATLAHPLNRPRFDPVNGKVVAGYTLLQPRVEIMPTSASQSLFTRVFAGDTGFDLYTRAVSDVYQDVFAEGSYVGKGIYDVAAFERSLAGRVPENALLSHDLLEGILGRAGLATDVVLLEDFPPHYTAYARRLHRWIRGDWQLLPWLLPQVPLEGGGRMRSDLSVLDRWKIFDNLRRSLISPTVLALLVAGWVWLPGAPMVWTLVASLSPAVSVVAALVTRLIGIPRGRPPELLTLPAWTGVLRWILALVFLPRETLVVLDAITSTLARMTLTHRNLLQWTTAAHSALLLRRENRWALVWRQMRSAPLFPLGLALIILLTQPGAIPAAVPLLVAWSLSPLVGHRISQPTIQAEPSLAPDERKALRRLARRTWLFFEQFVGPDDHWLPPDHFQEDPRGVAAHSTSPTNIGLMLLSALAASDLGYIGQLGLSLRLQATFATMDSLERYRGHFLNWYDTHTLAPLPPRYVSTVDSGNLAACLLTLSQGCQAVANLPAFGGQRWQGLLDTLGILGDNLHGIDAAEAKARVGALAHELDDVERQVLAFESQAGRWPSLLDSLESQFIPTLESLLLELIEVTPPTLSVESLNHLRLCTDRVRHHLLSMRRDLDLFLPWLRRLSRPPRLFDGPRAHPSLAAAWRTLVDALPLTPRLGDVPAACWAGEAAIDGLLRLAIGVSAPETDIQEARDWCAGLKDALGGSRLATQALVIGFQDLTARAEAFLQATDFGFLMDRQRQLFHIGYNVAAGKLDDNYYDLLASESRLTSLVAIAKHDVPQSHWLHLGRPMTRTDGMLALLSWGGTMFEYLMPALLMREFPGTLLERSSRAAVQRQVRYTSKKGLPWGISESGYYTFDASLNYQYRAFGVPGLGMKRGLGDDLVVAPYASLLALGASPRAVFSNIARFDRLGMVGPYGFYESVDYTRSRIPIGQEYGRVRTYMSHHHGMILLAILNCLHDSIMVQRFHSDPRVRSVEVLLQEQIPHQAPSEEPPSERVSAVRPARQPVSLVPWKVPADAATPQVHLLSNGRYTVLLTAAGAGYSRWQGYGLTRWRSDTTLEDWGSWIYLLDLDTRDLWSAGQQPIPPARGGEVLFYPDKAEFRRQDHGVSCKLEVAVAPGDDVEVRHLTLTNLGDRARRLALTSYAEVILAPQDQEQRHPAFNNLFIEGEPIPGLDALLFRRRTRSADEEPIHLVHMLATPVGRPAHATYETDRATFLGRGRTPRAPWALVEGGSELSQATGATLDPIMALSTTIELAPHAVERIAFVTLAARTRAEALALADRYHSLAAIDRALGQARTAVEPELREHNLSTADLETIGRLLSVLLYPGPDLRADPQVLASNRGGQSGLWAHGVSGDYPILLVRVESEGHISLVREVLRAHAYWRRRGMKIDLVIMNLQEAGYGQEMQAELHRLIGRMGADVWLNQRGGIFLVRSAQLDVPDRVLLATAARAILDGERGAVAGQLTSFGEQPARLPSFAPILPASDDVEPTPVLPRPTQLLFDNGLGGFSPDGAEYQIYLEPGAHTPAPWINVIANPQFGFAVSEVGSGYTWAGNSGENRLTPWANDPVRDESGEALYLRDEETAQVWSPTPMPAPAPAPYLARHGAGYTIFEHQSHGLSQRLRLFAVPDAPVKVVALRLQNLWRRPRRLTATYYARWVLGVTPETSQQYLVPEYEPQVSALLVHNPYSAEFSEHVAFLASSQRPHGLTADRTEFLGRMGDAGCPAALKRVGLAGTVRAGIDPCAAIQLHVDLPPGETKEVFFLLGQAADRQEALHLAGYYADPVQMEDAWAAAMSHWNGLLGTVAVKTPDPAMDLMLNRWLLYQTLSCRVWGRSALYQSSGAFGFRDQLQDVAALLHTAPGIAREHILRCAARQFEAGDVLHWWHPPSGRGVRTRCSDDLLWLPFITAHYVSTTGDKSILDEKVPFLVGEPLKTDENERYAAFPHTDEGFALYEHCWRALHAASTAGPHGLPLIGAGDWNDGMNRVGTQGRGESVWLGWFLYAALTRFAPLCDLMGLEGQALAFRQQAESLRSTLETTAWDGRWYLRGYYDDGAPLGSSRDQEWRIDSVAQSWSVLSGAGDQGRARLAMQAAVAQLVRPDEGLILLATPPFDKGPSDPGYIKGYPPGVRENGGNYTHAAVWTVWALLELGLADLAVGLYRSLNPVHRANTAERMEQYRVEPYVVAADICGIPPQAGRGGWTWYTGSAAWMYRLGLEGILGLRRTSEGLEIDPCIPSAWPGYQIEFRHGRTPYHVEVMNPGGVCRGVAHVRLDGQELPGKRVPLLADGRSHAVEVLLG